MKKFFLAASLIFCLQMVNAQFTDTSRVATTDVPKKKSPADYNLANRSNDHIMIQYGMDGWSGGADSTNPSGFSRHFNAYVMLDKPFKTNPKLSVAFGVGIGSSNIFFKNKYVNLKSLSTQLPFTNKDSADHFKKFKLTTVYLEAPVELRFSSKPDENNKSIKAAIGVKVGTMINAHTKGKTLVNSAGTTINPYMQKESEKKFFNTTKLALSGRVGYGIFSIHGEYQVTALLKDGVGPVIRPYSIGISISGL